MKVSKMPATAETAAALIVQQMIGRLRRGALRARLGQVTSWMVQRLTAESRRFRAAQGAHVRAFFEAAVWDFFVMVTLWLAKNLDRDPRTVLAEVPLRLPRYVPRKVVADSPMRRLRQVFVVADASGEYAHFLDRVQRIKATYLSQTDRVLQLVKALPGATKKDAKGWCLKGWSPFDITLDYLRIRYGLHDVGPDTLRKWLTLAKDPQRMIAATIVDLERRQGPLPWLRASWGLPTGSATATPEIPSPDDPPAAEDT